MAVNLGTRGVDEACDLLEYTNAPGGTALSDLRAKHGAADPYDIRLWCLGNEMDGPWQIGHKTADEYGRLGRRDGQAMRRIDPTHRARGVRQFGLGMPTFGQWERTVLEEAYEQVDYLSLHAYYEQFGGDMASFLASAGRHGPLDRHRGGDGRLACGAKLAAAGAIQLSFDEWNVWYQSRSPADAAPDSSSSAT